MSAQDFKKFTTGAREGQESILFTLFANRPWFQAFDAHPIHFAFMPLLGILFVVNMGIDWYQFKRAANKNYELLMAAIASTLSAMGAVAAIGGTLLGQLIGFSFVVGPYFFLGALGVGLVTNATFLGLNAYRAFVAPSNSELRKHHLQAMVANVMAMATLATIVASVILVMLVPGGPIATAAVGYAAVALTLASLTWRFMPNDTKQSIKRFLGFAKPKPEVSVAQEVQTLKPKVQKQIDRSATQSRLFAQSYRKHYVKLVLENQGREEAKEYLSKSIAAKNKVLEDKKGAKTDSKKAVLGVLERYLDDGNEQLPTKKVLRHKHPNAFQSALRSKGDIEDLVEAVELFASTNPSVALQQVPAAV